LKKEITMKKSGILGIIGIAAVLAIIMYPQILAAILAIGLALRTAKF
jgi:hypothetical protein